MIRSLSVFMMVIATANASMKVIEINAENEIRIIDAAETSYPKINFDWNILTIEGGPYMPQRSLLVDCTDTCDSKQLTEDEVNVLKTYATFITSLGRVPTSAEYGLLKDTETTNIYGLFVLHQNGIVNFFIRPSVVLDRDVLGAAILTLEIAAHERAHYINYYENSLFGHGDEFQKVYNGMFFRALDDVDKYVDFYNATVGEGEDITPPADVDVAMIVALVTLGTLAILIVVSLLIRPKPPSLKQRREQIKQAGEN